MCIITSTVIKSSLLMFCQVLDLECKIIDFNKILEI
jgi:hypothetical protein